MHNHAHYNNVLQCSLLTGPSSENAQYIKHSSTFLSVSVIVARSPVYEYTGCPIRYRTWHFFNIFSTNEHIATKFEADLPHCVRNVKEQNVLLFKFCCNIFIGVRIIKEMPGSVASGTPCRTGYVHSNFSSL